jgi:hypothetical protein
MKTIENGRFEVVMPRWLALACCFKRLAPSLFRAVFHRSTGTQRVSAKANDAK